MTEMPKISVIVPTRNRASFLPQLLELYRNQTWKNKELLVLDDSEQENETFKDLAKSYSDIKYWHRSQKLSIGGKRNALISESTGEIIAHFDDDDYYAPNYLSWMHREMEDNHADFVKLGGWFALHQGSNTLGFWDTTDFKSAHQIFCGTENIQNKKDAFTENALRSFLNGYGFSYLYKKDCWTGSPFPDRDIGEDSVFVEQLIAAKKKIHLTQDGSGLCLHIIHRGNTSRCFPNYIIPRALQKDLFPTLSKNGATSKELPTVSVCTLTHNRQHFITKLQRCIEAQDYPLEKIEWLILDDSNNYTHNLKLSSNSALNIKYQRIKKKLRLGEKRNLAHKLCSGNIIVYMDDDDFYFPTRVSHAVSTLITSGREIAGSTSLIIYYSHDQSLWLSGPFGQNHATAGTFAMTKEFTKKRHYNDNSECNEEKEFLNNYTIPMAQLDPAKTMVCISHDSNTFDKKKMRKGGESPRMKQLENEKHYRLLDAIREFHKQSAS